VDPAEFRRHGHALVDWIADYLDTVGDTSRSDRYPVLSQNAPGDIVRALPDAAPEESESFGAIMADFERVLVPGCCGPPQPPPSSNRSSSAGCAG